MVSWYHLYYSFNDKVFTQCKKQQIIINYIQNNTKAIKHTCFRIIFTCTTKQMTILRLFTFFTHILCFFHLLIH